MQMADYNHTEQCTLSVRLSTDGFAFALSRPLAQEGGMEVENWEVDATLPMAVNLRQAFERMEWLGRPFRRVNVLVATKRFTLMPLEYFDEEQVEDYFYLNHAKEGNEQVEYNILRNSNAVVLFGVDRSVAGAVQEWQPGAKLYAQVSPLADAFSVKSRLDEARKAYVHVRREYIDVLAYEGGRLLLANAYQCRQTPDALYYVLCLWQTLGFDQEHDQLYLLGDLEARPGLAGGLREFVRWVSVMEPAGMLDLQSVLLCG